MTLRISISIISTIANNTSYQRLKLSRFDRVPCIRHSHYTVKKQPSSNRLAHARTRQVSINETCGRRYTRATRYHPRQGYTIKSRPVKGLHPVIDFKAGERVRYNIILGSSRSIASGTCVHVNDLSYLSCNILRICFFQSDSYLMLDYVSGAPVCNP